jgi:glycine dehydrogenase subunit 2
MRPTEPLIFALGDQGRVGYSLPAWDVPRIEADDALPKELIREPACLPQLSEAEVIRHYVRLSSMNYSVDEGLYPLGSCTMKYNPKVNEDLARLPGFSMVHPWQPKELSQGSLKLMHELERALAEITGMDAVTVQPAAGAQGELVGMMMIRAFHRDRGQLRDKVLIPDTAHGTNPASCTLTGYKTVTLKSSSAGILQAETVAKAMDERVAALMLTNPNTLGLFETPGLFGRGQPKRGPGCGLSRPDGG